MSPGEAVDVPDELVETRTNPYASTSLPRPTSSFVGRDDEIAAVSGLIRRNARLVTLTGPGGSGKTRLAIEVAAGLTPDFNGAVHWISLAVLRSPRLFNATVAGALGAPDSVATHIGSQRLLLVLDNFEQIVSAAPEVVTLLEACPALHVLATSREVLRVAGETEFAVPPLAGPDAVELFCSRATLTPDDTIGELCARLDNLPLALELAAARTRVLSPSQILSRLPGRLDLFQGGRGTEPRQQTLRAAIEWSCELLDARDLRLFTRLGVFHGGCTVEAAEAVADADIDALQSLVDKNLLRHSGERFWMLETIREYAVELLAGSAEADAIRSRHVDWCIQFLQTSERRLMQGHVEAAQEMEQEYGNVRAAFTWCIATDHIDDALSLARPRLFWQSVQTHALESQEWIETVLARVDDVEPALRVRALTTVGDVRRVFGDDLEGARAALERALALERELPDDEALAMTAYTLARVEMAIGNYVRAEELTNIGLASARSRGDHSVAIELSAQLAELTYRLGDARAAETLAEDLIRADDFIDPHSEGDALRVLAMVARDAGDQGRARSLLGRCLALMRRMSDTYCVSSALGVLGDVELRAGRSSEARAAFCEALELQRTLGRWHRAVDSLWGVGASDVAAARLNRGALLLAAEEKMREDLAAPVQVTSPEHHDAVRRELELRLDSSLLETLWSQGRSLHRDEAIGLALTDDGARPEPDRPTSAVTGSAVLRQEGDYWTVRFGGDPFRLRDSKGLHHLAVLLRGPGREFHVLDLVINEYGAAAAPVPADAGPVLDERAKADYRARLSELEDDLAEATSWSDAGRVAKAQQEMEFLTAELAGALGLGGRDRRAGSQAERARVNVTRAIRSSAKRIRALDPALGQHLDATLHTGTFCAYRPDPRQPITWAF